jgi:hypothetical protein
MEPLMLAANVLREADKIPQYKAVLDAYERIAELQVKHDEQLRTILKLKDELDLLRKDQASAEGCEIWQELLWLKWDDNPYCIHCFDKHKRLFHVIRVQGRGVSYDSLCPECKSKTERAPMKSIWQVEREQRIDSMEVRDEEDAQ